MCVCACACKHACLYRQQLTQETRSPGMRRWRYLGLLPQKALICAEYLDSIFSSFEDTGLQAPVLLEVLQQLSAQGCFYRAGICERLCNTASCRDVLLGKSCVLVLQGISRTGPFPLCANASGESAWKSLSQGGWSSSFASARDPQVQPSLQKCQANILDPLALLRGWRGENA